MNNQVFVQKVMYRTYLTGWPNMYTAKVLIPIRNVDNSIFIMSVYILNRTGITTRFFYNTGNLVKPDRVNEHRFIIDHVPTTCSWEASRVKDAGLSKNTYDFQQTKVKQENMQGFLRAARLQIEVFHGLPGLWVKPFNKAF